MKKILVLAIAAMSVTPAAFAETSAVDIYGRLNIAIEDQSGDGAVDSSAHVRDYNSYIGFKGAEDLGNGLKAVFQYETTVNLDGSNNANGGFGTLRNSYIGLSDSWGTVLMGTHDTPYKMSTGKLDVFVDSAADYNDIVISAAQDARASSTVAYFSPDWSGFKVGAAVVADGGTTGDNFDSYSLMGTYDNGPFTIALGYQDLNTSLSNDQTTKIGLGYTVSDWKIGFVYEEPKADNSSAWLLNGAYKVSSALALKASYGVKEDLVDDGTQMALGVDYSMSKRTTAYAVFANEEAAGALTEDYNTFSIGMKHSF